MTTQLFPASPEKAAEYAAFKAAKDAAAQSLFGDWEEVSHG